MAIDPVCGMEVTREAARHTHQHEGQGYYFCGASCREKFANDPHGYLSGEAQAAAEAAARDAASAGALFTCPMHPEIVKDGPGSCPLCGMALEPQTVSLDDGPNPELVDFTRRFWIGLVFALPLLIFEMGGACLRAQGACRPCRLGMDTTGRGDTSGLMVRLSFF